MEIKDIKKFDKTLYYEVNADDLCLHDAGKKRYDKIHPVQHEIALEARLKLMLIMEQHFIRSFE